MALFFLCRFISCPTNKSQYLHHGNHGGRTARHKCYLKPDCQFSIFHARKER